MPSRPLRSGVRFMVAHGLTHITPTILINEWPKSGGTWISNLISTALDLPFFDNATPRFVPQVLKGHFFVPGTINRRRCVVVWRDGRDVMASWYHHSFFKFHDIPINYARVAAMRERYQFADYADIRANLPAFLEREFKRPSYPRFTWPQFVERWHARSRCVHVKYEDFRAAPAEELTKTLAEVAPSRSVLIDRVHAVAEQFDIAKIKANRGVRKGKAFFVRSGKAGGWRDVYSSEALDIFNHYAGDAMTALGYEADVPKIDERIT